MELNPLHVSGQSLVTLIAESWGTAAAQHLLLSMPQVQSQVVQLEWDTRNLGQLTQTSPVVRLFFARKGNRFNPAQHVAQLLDQGILVAIDRDDMVSDSTSLNERNALLIGPYRGSTHELLQAAASQALIDGVQAISTVAITGTNGKTSTTSLTQQLLASVTGQKVARLGTLGFFDGSREHSHLFPTTPDFPTLCIFLNHIARSGTKHLVMEASSHALAEGRLFDRKFAAAGMTNLTPDHLDFHGSMEAYWGAKQRLFLKHLGTKAPAVIAAAKTPWKDLAPQLQLGDHPLFLVWDTGSAGDPPQGRKAWEHISLITYEMTSSGASDSGIRVRLGHLNDGVGSSYSLHLPLIEGAFQAENFAVAMSLCHGLGVDWAELATHATLLLPVAGRMETVSVPGSHGRAPLVLVDYAHTPDAMSSLLTSVRAIAQARGGRIFTVFGCGGDRDRTKRPIMGRIATELSDVAIITSDNPRSEDPNAIIENIAAGAQPSRIWTAIVDRAKAIERAICESRSADIVVIAGKGHENYQIIGQEQRPFSDAGTARKVLLKLFPDLESDRGPA